MKSVLILSAALALLSSPALAVPGGSHPSLAQATKTEQNLDNTVTHATAVQSVIAAKPPSTANTSKLTSLAAAIAAAQAKEAYLQSLYPSIP